MIKAAIYARYSSDNQKEESITAQVRACTDYCKQKGYVVVETYTDEAYSATTDDRPAFQRLIGDAGAGLFDVAVVHKLDRFARNRYDSAIYRRKLKKGGVRLESVLEQLDDSPESVILLSVLEGMNEYYSKNLAREIKKGMKEVALQAKHTGGIPPLGYDVDANRNYVINAREAQAVRLIFSMYNQGASYGQIIKALNKEGFKTKHGKPFGKNSLHSILSNEKYAGIYVYNRALGRVDGRFIHRQTKPKSKIIRIPGGMPAIVDKHEWEKAKARMERQRQMGERARNRAKVTYLLSGLVICGKCGAKYVGNTTTNGAGRRYSFYECNRKSRTGECDNRRISKTKLESAILKYLNDTLFAPHVRREMARRTAAHYEKMQTHSHAEMKQIRKDIIKIDTVLANLLRAIESGQISKTILGQIKLREEEKTTLTARLERLQAQEEHSLTADLVEEYLAEMHQAFAAKENESQLKALVPKFIGHVIVFGSEIEIELRVSLVTVVAEERMAL